MVDSADLVGVALVHGESRLSHEQCLRVLLDDEDGSAVPRLCETFPTFDELHDAEPNAVAAQVGARRAAVLHCAFGLARRRAAQRLRYGRPLVDAGDVARLVGETTAGQRQESFFALWVDARHRVLAFRAVAVGHLRGVAVHPREVFGPALRASAAAVVVAHNHPTGDVRPSAEDAAVTERLRHVGELVGIELLDHVVVGRDRYYSFATERSYALGVGRHGAASP